MTKQEMARDRAARELARRLHAIAPDGLLADIDTIAAEFIQNMTAPNKRGAWRYIPTSPGITPVTPNPDAYERGAPLARQALHRKDPS